MKRVVYIDGKYDREKYVLKEDYRDMGLYREMTPNGYIVNQSWLVTDGDVTLVVYSYMNMCYEEMLELIDNYLDVGKFGIRGFDRGILVAHLNGDKDL